MQDEYLEIEQAIDKFGSFSENGIFQMVLHQDVGSLLLSKSGNIYLHIGSTQRLGQKAVDETSANAALES
jgi:hypothetical protein